MMLSVPASPAASQVELLSASVSGVASTGHRVLVNHNGRSVVVRVNDRCSYGLDLSLAAAQAIGLTEVGIAVVDVEVLEIEAVPIPSTSIEG